MTTPVSLVPAAPAKLIPTPEQAIVIAAIARGKENILVQSCAGGSKTTMLVMATQKMLPQPLLALVFNKKNADEMAKRFPAWVTVKTLNALGHGAWAKVCGGRLNLETKKIGNIVSAYLKDAGLNRELWQPLGALVNEARNLGFVPPGATGVTFGETLTPTLWGDLAVSCDVPLDEELFSMAQACLEESIKQARQGTIDFSDQIYMSACFGGVFPKFPTVLVDEAQDLSPLNHHMLTQVKGGRLIAVGDRYQGIYAFRGADSASMDTLKAAFAMREVTATTSFRCPKVICQRARRRHPTMTPWENAIEGKIENWDEWVPADITSGEAAIICRNNGPLVSLAFKLIRAGRGVRFVGNDLSKGLNKILNSLGEPSMQREAALAALFRWRGKENGKAAASGREELLARIEDKYQCLVAAFSSGKAETLGEAKNFLKGIFAETVGNLVMCTGHKAKGLEFSTVYFLDPWRIPSQHAKRAQKAGFPGPMEQELNLWYVITTRAKETLVHLNLSDLVEELSPEEKEAFTPEGGALEELFE